MAKILIVDDDPSILRLVKKALTLSGHLVATSSHSVEFENLLEEHQPEAVILDIKLPGKSGYDLLKELRNHPKFKDLPVLFLTGLSNLKDRLTGLRSTADDYLSKPFELEELTLRIEKLIATRNRYYLSSGIQGSLDIYSLPDLLQVLQRDRRTGILTLVRNRRAIGSISLRDGAIVSAWRGALKGDDAILEMIDKSKGKFSFEVKSQVDIPQSFPPSIPLQSLLFLDAQLRDELVRISAKKIGKKTRWWLMKEAIPDRPAGLPDLPFKLILDNLALHSGSTLKEISTLCCVATIRVRLSLAWLWNQGIVNSERPKTKSPSHAEA